MSKFTLEVELEDDRYCNGCINLDNYSWCRAAYLAGRYGYGKWDVYHCDFDHVQRPSWCPLKGTK